MDPEERAWQETQRRMLETGHWTYPGRSPADGPASRTGTPPPEPAVPATSSLDDVLAARAAKQDAAAKQAAGSLMRRVREVDPRALTGWKGRNWPVSEVPDFYRPVVADLLARVGFGQLQSGWVLTDDEYDPSQPIVGMVPSFWVTDDRFQWWDVAGKSRRQRCVALLDSRAERVRCVRIQLEQISDPDARRASYYFIAFFSDGARCASNANAQHRFENPNGLTSYLADYLDGGSRPR